MATRPEGDSDAPEELVDLRRANWDLQEQRASTGTIARELQLRALANEHRAAYKAFLDNLEEAAVQARKFGMPVARVYLRTHVKADIHLLGRLSPVVSWYIRQQLSSPVYTNRMLRPGRMGMLARAQFAEYVEEHALRPGLEALWKQLGGEEQTPRMA